MSATTKALTGARTLRVADLSAAALWVLVVVPPSFGFWLVAGDLAGIPAGSERSLLLGSLLTLGIATLVQAAAGCRLPVFEGPASMYLAAIAVLSASAGGARPGAVTGGLVVGGALVVALGVVRADRLMRPLFTPVVVATFVVVVVVAVVPPTVERALGLGAGHPWGTTAAWVSAAVVAVVGLGSRATPALRPYGLLLALLLGVLTHVAIAGAPPVRIEHGLSAPEIFPWGAPQLSVTAIVPFAIAGVLASLNTMASMTVMATATGRSSDERSERRGLLAHGGSQLAGSCVGNILGNVPRLDSVGVVQMIGNDRPQALALAGGAIVAIAFAGPAVDLLAVLPVPVSASLLALVLGMLAAEGLRQVGALHWTRRWLVFLPAVAPTVVWLIVVDSLSEVAQLVANPLLIGVVLAIVLDRALPAPSQRPHPTGGAS